jgi:hypothetical protein
MFSTHSVAATQQTAAQTARERLLNDTTMRRHCTTAPQPPAPSHTATVPSASRALTPTEQEQQAITIAKSFKQHYLASITYCNDQQLATALIKPINAHELPHEIQVDADGNADIVPHGALPVQRKFIGRTLLVLSILALFAFLILV